MLLYRHFVITARFYYSHQFQPLVMSAYSCQGNNSFYFTFQLTDFHSDFFWVSHHREAITTDEKLREHLKWLHQDYTVLNCPTTGWNSVSILWTENQKRLGILLLDKRSSSVIWECFGFPDRRQARIIVLKYEGRLTRTRGYQNAGADVSKNSVMTH